MSKTPVTDLAVAGTLLLNGNANKTDALNFRLMSNDQYESHNIDGDGNEVVSQAELITEVHVGYYYSSTLSVDDFDQINATLSHSNGILKIHSEKQYQLNIYDIRGSLIIEKDIQIGDNYINSSIIPNHMYFLNFIQENGTSIFKKIILN